MANHEIANQYIEVSGVVYTFKEWEREEPHALPALSHGETIYLPPSAIFSDGNGREFSIYLNNPNLHYFELSDSGEWTL